MSAYEVEFTSTAAQAFDALTPGARVEVMQKLEIIERTGVMSEHKIGEINSDYLVHVLNPSIAESIVTIWGTIYRIYAGPITVTRIAKINLSDPVMMRHLVTDAASQIGIPANTVQIF